MRVEEGWRFSTADFSVDGQPGQVVLVRDTVQHERWCELLRVADGDLKELPPLFVRGTGMSFEDALVDANLAASHVEPL